jgi:ABC-2 type transport system ATP-binding protein
MIEPNNKNKPAIQVEGIGKVYPKTGKVPAVRALKGVDLRVDRNAVFCILGPNGAGKTTLISILSGLLFPDAGKGVVWGLDILKEQRKIRRIANFASGQANLPDNFTMDEMLNYFGMLYGLKKDSRRKKAEELACFFDMEKYRKLPFNQLSTGLKQRVVLAKALVNDPKVLFLDEPTVGLDPQACMLIRGRLMEWHRRAGNTIILTTHQMDEAEQMSDRIAFLRDGRFIRLGGPEELKKSIRFHERVAINGRNFTQVLEPLGMIPGVSQIRFKENEVSFQIDTNEKNLGVSLKTVLDAGAAIEHVEISKPTLGDVFVELANQSDTD